MKAPGPDCVRQRTARFTFRVAVPFADVLPCAYTALMVVVPVPDEVASPKFVTTATPALLEVQVAKVVNTCVLLSLNVPVAMNCRLCPVLIVALAGVTASEVSVALVTFTEIVPAGTDPNTALMVAVPGATPRTTPALAETVATEASVDVQTAEFVRSCVFRRRTFPSLSTGRTCPRRASETHWAT